MKNATGKYSCVKRQFSEMNSDKLYNQINSDDKRSTTNFHMERNSQSTFPYTKIRKVDNKSLSLNKFDVKPKYHEALLDKGLIKETEWNGSRRIRRM